MKRLSCFCCIFPLLGLLAACAPESTEPEAASAAAAIEEIPVTTTSDEARAIFEQGLRALDLGRGQDANALFKQAAAEDPAFTYAYVGQLSSPTSADEYMKNLELAESSMTTASQGEQILVQIARTFVDVDAGKRLKLAKQLVDAYPASPRAWLQLGMLQAGMRNTEGARTSMRKALELDASFTAAHRSLGHSYLFSEPKDLGQGEEYMRRVVESEPEEASAHVDLGDAYRAQNKLQEARDAYAVGAELDPTSALALSKKGHANSFLGNYDEARSDYAQAIEVAKDQVKVNYSTFKAFVHAYAGDPKAALQELEQVYGSIDEMGLPEDQLDGAKLNVLTGQSRIALHEGVLDVAERALERWTEHLRTQVAVVADDDFTQAQEANIALVAGELAARAGDYETAVAKAGEVARLVAGQTSPRKMEGYHSLMGLTHLLQGNHQEAVDHYRKADPDDIWVKYHLGLALEGAGDPEAGAGLFQEVADWNFNSATYACLRKDSVSRAQAAGS